MSTAAAGVDAAVRRAADLLAAAGEVTLVAHVHPDADTLGAALGLGAALHRRGVRVTVGVAEPARVPPSLARLDTFGLLVPPAVVPAAPEVLVACDTADPARLGALRDRLHTAGTSVLLDHHASNPGFGDVRVLDPTVEATVVLVHRVLVAMGVPLDPTVARCLYAGLFTDTRGFRGAGPAAHRLAAALVEAGAEPEEIVRPLDEHPFAWLAGLGGVLAATTFEPQDAGGLGVAYARVPADVVRRFRPEDVDGVVDVVRTAAEPEVAAVLKEVGEGRWSVSLRSHGRVDVAAAAAALGGGGHRRAAGATVCGAADEVLAAVRTALATATAGPAG